MIARCNSNVSSPRFGQKTAGDKASQFPLTPGVSYLVLGISTVAGNEGRTCEILYQVLNDYGGISHAPARIFDLQDGNCSASWTAKYEADGSLLLWPREFFVEFFHDDLSEGDSAAIEVLRRVVTNLKEEAGYSGQLPAIE